MERRIQAPPNIVVLTEGFTITIKDAGANWKNKAGWGLKHRDADKKVDATRNQARNIAPAPTRILSAEEGLRGGVVLEAAFG